MPKVIIDGTELEVENGTTLIQACEMAGAEIPRFCYHDRLSIAGNCRMCLVEVKGAPKPQASCAMSVNDLRPGPEGQPPEILTNSAQVKKAREGVMEFLLINHPLDCPICDQGGECDLQDQAMAYGIDKNRFHENKRAVEDKYIGPLIKTEMTRCIQCTRCVRFSTEIGGVEELGAIGRGEDMEITTYLEKALSSELQGNVIDLCPVGALTSAPYEFKARPWELRKTEAIDVMDAVGSNIRVDARGREVMRVLPRLNEDVNEEWISDKTRFIWDGLNSQRLDTPYIRRDGKLSPASWDDALALAAEKIGAAGPEKTAALMGDLNAVEDMFALKSFMNGLGVKHVDCRPPHVRVGEVGGRGSYLLNFTIAGLEDADVILLVGTNPRLEASLVNVRIRKAQLGGALVGMIGEAADLTYPCEYLGDGPEALAELAGGKSKFARALKKAERAAIIVGEGALARSDGAVILAQTADLALSVKAIRDDWNGFGVLHTAAARVGGLEICCLPSDDGGLATADILKAAQSGNIDVVYLLGVDEIDMKELGDAFVIYQGSHGDAGAHRADLILPGAAYTEKQGTYVNTEGRVQISARAAFPPGEAREDWKILRALSEHVGEVLPFDTLEQLRAKIHEAVPHLANVDEIHAASIDDLKSLARSGGKTLKSGFSSPVKDYYMTNPIARASRIMAECSALRAGRFLEAAE